MLTKGSVVRFANSVVGYLCDLPSLIARRSLVLFINIRVRVTVGGFLVMSIIANVFRLFITMMMSVITSARAKDWSAKSGLGPGAEFKYLS